MAPPSGSDWTVWEYYYNAAWQVLQEDREVITRTGSPLGEPAVADDIYCQYVWDIRYIDAPVLRDRNDDDNTGTGDLGLENVTPPGNISGLEERLYYTTDANFNVTAVVSAAGAVLRRYEYDPYGQVAFLTDGFGTSTNVEENEILFAGYRLDDETSLYHVRHRTYHPTLGRWITRDPAGYIDGHYMVVSRTSRLSMCTRCCCGNDTSDCYCPRDVSRLSCSWVTTGRRHRRKG